MSLETAKEEALEEFRKWNAVTGAFNEQSAWYWELKTKFEEAVEIGWKAAEEDLEDD